MKAKAKYITKPDISSLTDLIDIKEWKKIQDDFSQVASIGIRTLGPQGNLIISPSGENRLCELIKDSKKRELICGKSCLPAFLGGKGIVDKDLSYVCFEGLHNFIVPIKLDGSRVLGYLVLGPVILIKHKAKEEYKKTAEDLNVSLEDLWSAILELKVVSVHGIRALVKLVEDICEYTVRLAYRNIIKERRMFMALSLSKLNKILNDLLDVAFEISQADIGSMMFLDPKRTHLTIRASRGIPPEIAARTRVKIGEGVSGIAAKEGKPFLIDDNRIDNRLKPYLNRPNLASSMIIPLKLENKVIGVINLGAKKTSSIRFGENNMNLMNKLVGLVTVAISPSS